jgi:hypothetical protein
MKMEMNRHGIVFCYSAYFQLCFDRAQNGFEKLIQTGKVAEP